MLPADLPATWRTEAAVLRKNGDERGAFLRELAADELEAALRARDDEPVTPEQAEAEGVCGAEAVRARVRRGQAENVGTATRIAVRRSDLPRGRKASQSPSFGKAVMRAADTTNRRRGL